MPPGITAHIKNLFNPSHLLQSGAQIVDVRFFTVGKTHLTKEVYTLRKVGSYNTWFSKISGAFFYYTIAIMVELWCQNSFSWTQ